MEADPPHRRWQRRLVGPIVVALLLVIGTVVIGLAGGGNPETFTAPGFPATVRSTPAPGVSAAPGVTAAPGVRTTRNVAPPPTGDAPRTRRGRPPRARGGRRGHN